MLLFCWVAGNLIALYLPVSYSGRFVLGLFIPVVLLAVNGLEEILLPSCNRIDSGTLRRMVIWLTLPSTIILILWTLQISLNSQNYPYFYSSKDVNAVAFLAEQTTEEDIVLVDYPMGNYLSRVSKASPFVGHLNLTIDLDNKLALLDTFWDPATSIEWRENFIQEWGVTYVYQGTFESGRSEELANIPGIVIYHEEGIIIYRID